MTDFAPVPELLEELKKGRCIILVDDEDRENEGDLVCAAEFATAENINFMAKAARGLICLTLTEEQCQKLDLPLMVNRNTAQFGTAFTVSIDAIKDCTTGISAADRSRTILTAIRKDVVPDELARPGHIFPLRAQNGGVLLRPGQTEGSIDLCRLAALTPAGVICEIMNEDGSMSRLKELKIFADNHHLKIGSIADIVEYRLTHDCLIERKSSVRLPTEFGEFHLHVYQDLVNGDQHLALVKGEKIKPRDLGGDDLEEAVLMRVHSECCTGDIFASLRCDCRAQLHKAMKMIEKEGDGLLLYLRQEGRGIGLEAKLKAYQLQDEGQDTVEANESLGFKDDERNYGIGSQIVRDLGIRKMKLMSNNPKKLKGLQNYGLEVIERVAIEIPHNPVNYHYLKTKKNKLGHLLDHL
jgi:3,4-dihydroxy 2-butanone 4-phosphate synthase/GTP cyclohydrolase II